jgi:hydrogenase-4 component B
MEYTATAFANPFKRLFTMLYRPVRQLTIDFHPGSRFFIRTMAYRNEVRPIVEEALYRPAARAGHWLAGRIQALQSGSVHLYLAYILVTLIALLALAR